jgi:hypothetical protein
MQIDSQTKFEEVASAVENHHRGIANTTLRNFYLPPEDIQNLWELSLSYEQYLFPNTTEIA